MADSHRREHPRVSRTRRYLGRFLLLLTPLVLAFVIAETALRLTGPPATPDPAPKTRWLAVDKSDELGWIFPPDTTGVFKSSSHPTPVTTNAWGLRGPAVPTDPLTRHVLVLGDSYTFGWGVNDKDGFVRLLENSLRQRFPDTPVSCINGGLPGYSIYQQVRMLAYVQARTRLDVVVATVSLANDPVDELRIRRFAPDHLADFSYELRDPATIAAHVIGASRLLTLIDERTTNVQFSLRNTDRRCRDLATESMLHLAGACSEADLPLVWVIVPRAQEIRPGRFWRRGLNGATNRLRTHFLGVAQKMAVPVVDLKPVLLAAQVREETYLSADAHWNESGHRTVATAVLPVLLQVWQP